MSSKSFHFKNEISTLVFWDLKLIERNDRELIRWSIRIDRYAILCDSALNIVDIYVTLFMNE